MAVTRIELCPPDHKHGANTTCYFTHGCRCDDCTESMRLYTVGKHPGVRYRFYHQGASA